MGLSSIARLYWVWLKALPVLGQELLAGLGLAVGVALLFASQIASVSLNGSAQVVTSELVNQMQFQLDARDLQGFEQRLLGEIRGLPGVRLAVPVLQEPVTVTGPAGERTVELIATQAGTPLNASPLLRKFDFNEIGLLRALILPVPVTKQIGVRASTSHELRFGSNAKQSGAPAGGSLKLWFDGRTVTTRLGRSLGAHDIGRLVNSPIAVASLAYAQSLTGMHERITRVFVRAIPGHDREVRADLLRLAAGVLNVEPANFDATLFKGAAAPANQSQSLFLGISALVGFLFAFNAILLTLPMRRRLVRSLRINGATRADIVKILVLDALILGLLASLLGLALGDLLSLTVFRSSPGYLSLAFPVSSQRIVTWQCIGLPVGAGTLAACVGVLISLSERSSRLGRGSISTSRRPSSASPLVASGAGLLCVALTTAILAAAPQSAVLGSVSLMLGLLLLLPRLLDAAVELFGVLQAHFASAATRVAAIELLSPNTRARSIAIAATGAVAVFGTVALGGATANLQSGLDRSSRDIARSASLWIVPSGGQDVLATTPFREGTAPGIADLPGVRAIGLYRASFLDYGNRRVWVMAPPPTTAQPIPANQLVAGKLALATSRLRAGGWAVLSQALAERQQLHIGQSFKLPSPQAMTLRLAAITTNLGWAPGAIILNSSDYAHAWGSTEVGAYSVAVAPGASTLAVRQEMLRALSAGSGLAVETAQHREQDMRSAARQGLSRLGQIGTLVQIAAVIAMSIAMGAMIWQRRPRLARLKVQGYASAVLWRAVICESGVLLGTGCLVGAVFGIYGQLLISHALATVTGFPIVFSAGARVAALSTVLVSGGALSIVALLGYRAASVPPGL